MSVDGSMPVPNGAALHAVAATSRADATSAASVAPPQAAAATTPGTLRFVVTYSHELSRSEKAGLAQIRAALEHPSKVAIKVTADPATEEERRYIDEYLAAIEQTTRSFPPFPPSWLHYEAVIALPIHAPINVAGQKLAAGYRDLLIFRPPAQEAAYASHYSGEKLFGPRLTVELGNWLKKHLQLQEQEGTR